MYFKQILSNDLIRSIIISGIIPLHTRKQVWQQTIDAKAGANDGSPQRSRLMKKRQKKAVVDLDWSKISLKIRQEFAMPILIILYQNKLIASLIPPIYFCVSDPHIPLEAWIIQKVQVSSPRLTRSDPDPGQGTDQGQGLGLPKKKKMKTHKSIAPFYGDLAWPAFANSMETPGELMRISI